MHVRASLQDISEVTADLLVVPLFEGVKKLSGRVAEIDRALNGLLSEHIAHDKFEGKAGTQILIRTFGKIGAARIVLLGVGVKPFGIASARAAGAQATKVARAHHSKTIALLLPEALSSVADVTEALAEGAVLGDYRFLKYKDEELKKYAEGNIASFTVLVAAKKEMTAAEKGIRLGAICSHATILARGLVNEPASYVTPSHLADVARALAAAQPKRLTLEIFDKAKLEEMGAGGILAIAKGSQEPPFMMHLAYKPTGKPRRKIAVVGKGITFDSGGLSIKPAVHMEDMKIDMAGCAVMLGVMSALTELAPDIEVHGISAVCENMPSGTAVRPGDIIRTMSGKTVEILNTDAEGRVTLADALHYAAKLEPDYIIDLATLTGAVMVALGEEVAGLMSNNRKLAQKLIEAGGREGETLWELPLVESYRKNNKSQQADLRNIGTSRYGDAIIAGLFLEEFVGKTPWAHLDIAGPASLGKETAAHLPSGATGFGVRTLLEFIQNI